jgi:regulator of protease activity HflC (stomatin/prohibitin superfamily)
MLEGDAMPIQFNCPSCSATLSISRRKAGELVACPKCKKNVQVPIMIEDAKGVRVRDAHESANGSSVEPSFGRVSSAGGVSAESPFKRILSGCLIAAGTTGLASLISLSCHFWVLGSIFLFLFLVVVALTIKGLLDVTTAKARAIQRGEREVDLFFRCVKLVLWEANEGLLFLKDKRIHEVIYGPECGGGMRFIFPIFGDEIKVHVPLTLQLSHFKDHKVLTRDSFELMIKVAIWWRIKDREGLEDFYLLIDKEIHLTSDEAMQPKDVDFSTQSSGARKSPKRAELNAAERWLMTLVESSLRKLVSRTSVAWVISKNASAYLHVGRQHDEKTAQPIDEDHATPDLIANSLKDMLCPEVEKYGLEIDRIEIQEVRLQPEIQEAIDRLLKATLLPAQASQEALARAQQIEAELGTIAKILGTEAAGAAHIAKSMQGMSFFGGMNPVLEQLLAPLMKKSEPQLQKLANAQAVVPVEAGPGWTPKPEP